MRSRRIAGALLGLFLAVAPLHAADGFPHLLADVNRTAPDGFLRHGITGFFQLGDRLLFSATLGTDNGILWSTDGTPGGTAPVSSTLCPSDCKEIRPLKSWNGLTFLSVYVGEGSTAQERLFRTDGTPQGTFQLLPRDLGDLYFESWTLQAAPDSPFAYFVACDPEEGCRLWRSDGTVAGTAIVKTPDGVGFENPDPMVLWNGRLWFVATHGGGSTHGLWSTDGTPEGTRLLQEIVADYYEGSRLLAISGRLFFSSGENGEDLWATDGSPEGTRRLVDFQPSYCHPSCSHQFVDGMFEAHGRVHFVTRREGHGLEIWTSDGTEAGTGPQFRLPDDASGGLNRIGDSWIFFTGPLDEEVPWLLASDLSRAAPMTCTGGKCPRFVNFLPEIRPGERLFAGSDPRHGLELWITDGTGPGTRRLTDACPGDCPGLSSPYGGSNFFQSPGGEVYFEATSGEDQNLTSELWVTDGTPAGTYRVLERFSAPGFLDGRVFFGLDRLETGAVELRSLDGPSSPSRRVKVLRRFAPGSDPVFLPLRNGTVLGGQEGDGRLRRLWRSDGTPEGTAPFFEFPEGRRYLANALGPAGRFQLLEVIQWEDRDKVAKEEIWRTDGTPEGTRLLLTLGRLENIDIVSSWTGGILFSVWSPHGCSIWTSDGTGRGTRETLRLPECPWELIGFGPSFLFVANDGHGDREQAYISDGTPAGTRQLTFFQTSREGWDYLRSLQVGRTMYFSLLDGDRTEIWRTDGTPRGTRQAFPDIDSPDDLTLFHGSFYFTGQLPGSLEERGLYRAPLEGGAPVLLAKVGGGIYYGGIYFHLYAGLTPAGDRLVFAAQDPAHGAEPWVTDGTPAGTHLLADLLPGPDTSSPYGLTGDGSRVFFSARDPEGGEELWETDGTAAGTRRVQNLAPGGASSSPRRLTVSNGVLFFAADDGRTGVEPWALRLP